MSARSVKKPQKHGTEMALRQFRYSSSASIHVTASQKAAEVLVYSQE